ncbi:HepT-like ribonuclease domain-containing protein [Thermoflexibacter ruber]|uniref:Uncharacterized conserved protein, contains HEPN domain n=1 Tax=Thermoflexibacter ruber TaxID=1003 RepID=A0A1I2FHL6_9BACT|nr:HepT-like ribonuclease domain-containing protein [Thermoflexibacter ruber]SFF04912.1 Uncharacterized conserved protein, contains HEPN domain [Thermoflexibacter ruber]
MSDRLGDKVRLQHIADAIIEIRNYTQGVSSKDFVSNSMMKNACIRQLEVIGEASSRISDELKNEYIEVAWRQIIGLRNLLIHEYFGVDENVVLAS